MTVATGTTFIQTRNDLIYGALSMLGISEPQNEDVALGVKKLNVLLKNLDTKGRWLWCVNHTPSSLTTVSSQASYATGATSTTISTNIIKITNATVTVGNSYIPLEILDQPTALKTSLRTSSGQPEAIYLERATLRANNKLFIYPTPNSAFTILYNFQRPIYTFENANDNPDLPDGWLDPLEKMLAYRLSYDYSKPLAERQMLQQESQMAYAEIRAFSYDSPSYQPQIVEYF